MTGQVLDKCGVGGGDQYGATGLINVILSVIDGESHIHFEGAPGDVPCSGSVGCVLHILCLAQ